MSSKIQETQKKSYNEVLKSTISFHIPAFQRSYKWMPKQVSQLWESLISNDSKYYIGNIVVVNYSAGGIESGLLVIDGQQRITTLSLFLVAIRDFIKKDKSKNKKELTKHDERIKEIETHLIHRTSFGDGDAEKLKIIFSKSNLASVYNKIVFGEELDMDSLDDAQKRFLKNLNTAKQLFREFLKDTNLSTKNAIDELYQKIINLEFIIIACQNESDVYQIFEGLNSTGLELSVVDLVKNAIFKVVGDLDPTGEMLNEAELEWAEMESYFEDESLSLFPKFLRHRWISLNGYINTSQLYDKIKAEVRGFASKEEALDFIKEMKRDASLYVALRTGDANFYKQDQVGGNKRLIELLVRFKYLGSDQVYEVLLAYYKKYKVADEYTSKQFARDLEMLWNFGFQTKVLSSINPSKYERIFAERCKELVAFKGKDYSKNSKKFYEELNELLEGRESEFVENFSDIFEYKEGGSESNELIRILLREIYKQAKNNSVGAIYETTTIEHILPQKTYRNEPFLHKIGNLTILSDEMNKRAKDSSFALKYKNYFAKDIFNHNKELNKYDFDDEEKLQNVVIERSQDLAKEALIVFKVSY